ncbi:MAG: hypothetical protein CMN21_21090 [Rubinisphaera sp.]|nr:hypothetical protein [Rubinisphaera sp.]|tara:strand:- start:407 stop:850 length:444 start_codon:yes stop_codon:yes gene_type:complete
MLEEFVVLRSITLLCALAFASTAVAENNQSLSHEYKHEGTVYKRIFIVTETARDRADRIHLISYPKNNTAQKSYFSGDLSVNGDTWNIKWDGGDKERFVFLDDSGEADYKITVTQMYGDITYTAVYDFTRSYLNNSDQRYFNKKFRR